MNSVVCSLAYSCHSRGSRLQRRLHGHNTTLGWQQAIFSYFRVWGVRMASRMAEYREKSRRRKEMLKVTIGGVVI